MPDADIALEREKKRKADEKKRAQALAEKAEKADKADKAKKLERWMFLVLAVGTVLPMMHQSSLGTLLVVFMNTEDPPESTLRTLIWLITIAQYLLLIKAVIDFGSAMFAFATKPNKKNSGFGCTKKLANMMATRM